MLNGKSVLITGGTGSFGKKFVSMVLERYPEVKRLIIYSRDELKQFEMQQQFSPKKYRAMRYFIGDVRDGERLKRACESVDVIIHAAALKQVPAAEYNPFECIKTNVLGAQNVIEAALSCKVERVIALSTDKAAGPINLYGATKLCSDKLFIAGNNVLGGRNLRLAVVRYGNVMGSRGSVIPFFLKKKKEGRLPITHPEMTRFNISLKEGVELVFFALEKTIGGEVFIPKIPSYRVTELAEAIGPECERPIVGVRPGEKIHEAMVTETDALNTIETPAHYIITPTPPFQSFEENRQRFMEAYQAKPVPEGFSYISGENSEWLSVETLRELIKTHVDPNFVI